MHSDEFQRSLVAAREGDERAFAELWRAFNPRLARFVGVLADRNDVEDVVATVWLGAARGLDRFTGDAMAFRAWLFTMARHRVIDLRRGRGRRPRLVALLPDVPVEDSGLDPAAIAETSWSSEEAAALIARLPPDQAEVLLLRIVADLDVATVAAMVGKRPGTVRVLSHRGLRRLAQMLGSDSFLRGGVTR